MRAAVAMVFLGMLLLATVPSDTDAFFWRDVRRIIDDALSGLEKFWNDFKGYFDGVNWNNPSQVIATFTRIDCATLCPNCDGIPNNNGKSICKSYCRSTCAWSYKRSLDEDYLNLDQLIAAIDEE